MGRRERRRRAGQRLGQQPPRHRFFLNPYTYARFTTCPQCRGRMRARKLPLVIHIDPMQLIALNKTCRYCPGCDLLVAHRDEIEGLLSAVLGLPPEALRERYLVVGTEDRADWRRGMRAGVSTEEALAALHDFAEVVDIRPAPAWAPA